MLFLTFHSLFFFVSKKEILHFCQNDEITACYIPFSSTKVHKFPMTPALNPLNSQNRLLGVPNLQFNNLFLSYFSYSCIRRHCLLQVKNPRKIFSVEDAELFLQISILVTSHFPLGSHQHLKQENQNALQSTTKSAEFETHKPKR